MNELESLKESTIIVADTGDIESIARLKPQDATTNPSLILKAASDPKYRDLVIKAFKDSHDAEEACEHVLVNFGAEIVSLIPGRVSTEVDARLSFDTQATVEKARKIISLYEARGISRERVLIKIACTWEGAQACKILENDGIHCNMTLIFSLTQAITAANNNATLISPFVGRIYDWYKKQAEDKWVEDEHSGVNDPGVKSVRIIFERLKGAGRKTQIMGASFRNKRQILALAGCDLLTISPALLDELSSTEGRVLRQLDPAKVHEYRAESLTEPNFRFVMNQDRMANEKLSDGIRLFVTDTFKLRAMFEQMAD